MPARKSSRTSRDAQALEARREAHRQQLADAGLRVTAARLAVLEAVESAQAAVSHADIEAALAEPLDRVTLYRTLDSCVEAGLLTKSVGSDRVSRFALLSPNGGDHAEHAHFHCDDCGRVYCLPSRPPRPPAVPDGFAVEGVDLHVHGHCAACQPAPSGRHR
ncbi:Fur family transcriptional regulator [Aquincola sp. MAHUQ-54]|uniref:Fur family transcriptional regulator n=1 Tax=Aquincola agrisoli TaxID=3119538 RepID=A0AAW9Q671_9BURK